MSEWWTYRPSSFLMFSPRIYWRLFESMNDAFWPLQWLLAGALLAWLVFFVRAPTGERAARGLRGAVVFVALCWGFTAWAFLLVRFASINWPASWVAAVFFLQALGLLALGVGGGVGSITRRTRSRAGIALLLWAVLGHPLLGFVFGRPWPQAEFFGLAPDPTVVATLGLLLLIEPSTPKSRWLLRGLWFVAIACCAIGAATLTVMRSAQAWVVLALMLFALGASIRRR